MGDAITELQWRHPDTWVLHGHTGHSGVDWLPDVINEPLCPHSLKLLLGGSGSQGGSIRSRFQCEICGLKVLRESAMIWEPQRKIINGEYYSYPPVWRY